MFVYELLSKPSLVMAVLFTLVGLILTVSLRGKSTLPSESVSKENPLNRVKKVSVRGTIGTGLDLNIPELTAAVGAAARRGED